MSLNEQERKQVFEQADLSLHRLNDIAVEYKEESKRLKGELKKALKTNEVLRLKLDYWEVVERPECDGTDCDCEPKVNEDLPKTPDGFIYYSDEDIAAIEEKIGYQWEDDLDQHVQERFGSQEGVQNERINYLFDRVTALEKEAKWNDREQDVIADALLKISDRLAELAKEKTKPKKSRDFRSEL